MKRIVTRFAILGLMLLSAGLFTLTNFANSTKADERCPPTCDFGKIVCPMRMDYKTGMCVPAGDCYFAACSDDN